MAAKHLLTDLKIRNAKPLEKEYLISDGDRLLLRVRPNNEKDWFFIYTFNKKREKFMLGKYPTISLEEARKASETFRALLSNNINPKEHVKNEAKERSLRIKKEQQELEALANRMTVGDLFNLWEKLALRDRKDGGKEVRRMFDKDVLPSIGNMAVEDIKKSHIAIILNNLLDRGVNRMAKMILSLLRQMFRFAQDQDILEHDPTSSIRKSKVGGKDNIRDRILSDAEIKELGIKIPGANLLKSTECALWIMLSTCCRIGELCKSEWEHIDFETKKWKIPKENSKNGKPHTIHLSDFSIKEFKKLRELSMSAKWVFPNSANTNYVCEKSISKQVGDRQLSKERVEHKGPHSGRSKQVEALKLKDGKWTPHDLRRTGATIMGNLNVRPDVIEKCLNHIEQNKIKRTYQHQSLIKEQEIAWQLLGERIELITSSITNNLVAILRK